MQEPNDFSAIYGIRHILSGKIYVGSAVKVKSRWKVHINSLRKGKHHSKHLQNAWGKYGEDSFEFVILETVFNKNLLLTKENIWINKLLSADSAYGFNVCLTAGSQLGMKHSEETRKKMSESSKGKVKTESHQKAINESLTGRKLSDEHRRNLSEAKKGIIASDESRMKMSESRKGKTASVEARKKISDALIIRHAEARAKGLRISGVPLKKTSEDGGLYTTNKLTEKETLMTIPQKLPYQQRVITEQEELDTKMSALSKFFDTKFFLDLPDVEQSLLRKQYGYMQKYSSVLSERISNFIQQ